LPCIVPAFEIEELLKSENSINNTAWHKIFTSMYFLALSQAPPVLDAEIAICKHGMEICLRSKE